MFSLAAEFYEAFLKPTEVSILIVGLDGVGKTSLLERLKVTDFIEPIEDKISTNVVGKKHNKQLFTQVLIHHIQYLYRKYLYKNNSRESVLISQSKISLCKPLNQSLTIPCIEKGISVGGILRRENKQYDLMKGVNMLPLAFIQPTVGMNLSKVNIYGSPINIVDIGGKKKNRMTWNRYYAGADSLVFVVDISPGETQEKFNEAKTAFHQLWYDASIWGKPILIFMNKSDKQECYENINSYQFPTDSFGRHHNTNVSMIGKMPLSTFSELFLPELHISDSQKMNGTIDDTRSENNILAIFKGSAKTGEGVRSAFEWLIRKVHAGNEGHN